MATAAANPMMGMDAAAAMHLGRRAVVASIFPIETKMKRRYRTTMDGGHLTLYKIPACPIGSPPVIVPFGDAFEMVYLGEINGSKRWQEIPVPGGAPKIAEDMINAVRNNAIGASTDPPRMPGIWICAGSGPMPDEIEKWTRIQEDYFRHLVIEADDIYFKSRTGQGAQGEIGTLHRTAAAWLRFDPKSHEWMLNERKGGLKRCPFCSVDIDEIAVKCQRCGEVVDAARYAELKALHGESAKPISGKPLAAPLVNR